MPKQLIVTKRVGKESHKEYIALIYVDEHGKEHFLNFSKVTISEVADLKFSELDNLQVGESIIVIEKK